MIALDRFGRMVHNRYVSGTIFAPIPAGNSAELGSFGTVSCAAVGDNLHVAATLFPLQ